MGVTLLALGRFTLKGPYQATLSVGMLAVLAVFLPPISGYNYYGVAVAVAALMLATILVGLIILSQGSVSGLKAIGVSLLGVTLVSWLVLKSPEQGIIIGLVYWLPVVLLAQTLRSSQSLALTLLAGVGLGLVGIAAQYLLWTDLEASLVGQMVTSRGGQEQLGEGELRQIVMSVRLMGLLTISSLYLMFVLILFVARWLQTRLFEGKSFGEEFRALTLGKPAASIAIVGVLLGFLIAQQWIISIAFLLAMAFMFQGIAIVHAKLAKRKQPFLYLALFYFFLLFAAQITAALISITGMIDNWLVFRKKPEDRQT